MLVPWRILPHFLVNSSLRSMGFPPKVSSQLYHQLHTPGDCDLRARRGETPWGEIKSFRLITDDVY